MQGKQKHIYLKSQSLVGINRVIQEKKYLKAKHSSTSGPFFLPILRQIFTIQQILTPILKLKMTSFSSPTQLRLQSFLSLSSVYLLNVQ